MDRTSRDTMLRYHEASRHGGTGSTGPVLRWPRQPAWVETLGTPDALRLPRPGLAPARGTRASLAGPSPEATRPPRTAGVLGTILAYGHGVVGAHAYPGGALPRRPAPSAGGLYPCAAVVATQGTGEVPAGLYSYAPLEHALVPVRAGRTAARAVAEAAGGDPARLDPVVLLVASYWRSAWKYQARSLRYCAQDAGHAALALAAAAHGLDAGAALLRLRDPAALSDLLGLEADAAGVMGAVGFELAGPPPSGRPEPLSPLVRPAVEGEPVAGPLLEAVRAAVGQPAGAGHGPQLPVPDGPAVPLPELAPGQGELPLADAVARRHSVRRFRPEGIRLDQLGALLRAAWPGGHGPVACSVSARRVEGLEPGVYRYDPGLHRLGALGPALVADELAAAALGQAFVGQAAACAVPLADLGAALEAGGPRAYLEAFFDAGVAGQRLYLLATALGLGCCAVGAFDDAELARLSGSGRGGERALCIFPIGVPREA